MITVVEQPKSLSTPDVFQTIKNGCQQFRTPLKQMQRKKVKPNKATGDKRIKWKF